ncbi:uncharacterized protein LOC144433235 [Glandiceps talaboti]
MAEGSSEVDLSNMKLYSFPPHLTRETAIRKLDMAVNMMSSLPSEMKGLKELEHVKVSNNKFDEFPEIICEFPKLRTIDFDGNQIDTLPSAVMKLANLRRICLGWNAFIDFPVQLCSPQLSSMKEIHISHNRIRFLPNAISKLVELEMLDVSYNELEILPDSVCQLEKLKTLQASYNKLKSLPRELATSLKNLKVLGLKENPLQQPPLEICDKGIDAIRSYEMKKTTEEKLNPSLPTPRESGCSDLSSNMSFMIPPNAVKQAVNITAEVVETPCYTMTLKDHECLLGDFLDFGPDGYCFHKPIMFNFQCNEDLEDLTREVVVRTTEGAKRWQDITTVQNGNILSAEIEHFSNAVPVSRPRKHQFTVSLAGIDTLNISCHHNHVVVDSTRSCENNNWIILTIQLHNVDEDILMRATELVCHCTEDSFRLGTILEIRADEGIKNQISFTLPLPQESAGVFTPVERLIVGGQLRVLRDSNDDRWIDVTDKVNPEMANDRCVVFTMNGLPRSGYRLVVSIAEPWMDVGLIANQATSMARKGSKLAKFILMQDDKNPECLYVDCVLTEKASDLTKSLENTGYSRRIGLPYTRDFELTEGQIIPLVISGKGMETTEEYSITFNSRQDNHLQLFVELDDEGAAGLGNAQDYVGKVDFMKTTNRPQGGTIKYDTLRFKIPRRQVNGQPNPCTPSSVNVESSTVQTDTGRRGNRRNDNLEIAINILEQRLLPEDWKPLARYLELSDADIAAIEVAHPNKLRPQIYQMFSEWKKREGHDATVQILVDALERLKIRNLSQTIESLLDDTQPILTNQSTQTSIRPHTRATRKGTARVRRSSHLPYQKVIYTRRASITNRRQMAIKTINVEPGDFTIY